MDGSCSESWLNLPPSTATGTDDAIKDLDGAKNALTKLGGKAELFRRETPWGARTLVVVTKIGRIPIVYPRKAGIIKKTPL